MAIDLPYFRFEVQSWQNGDIALEDYQMQGIFISICGYYWTKDCSITLALLQRKYSTASEINLIEKLIELKILKHEKRHDKIEIVFLNKQYDLLSEERKRRQAAGSKGGNAKAKLQPTSSYKIRKEKIIVDKKRIEEIAILKLPFESEEFKKKWEVLKNQKKWKGKSFEALQGNLETLGKNCELDALKMMQKAINGGWQGVFELDEKEKSNNERTQKAVKKPIEHKKDYSGGFSV